MLAGGGAGNVSMWAEGECRGYVCGFFERGVQKFVDRAFETFGVWNFLSKMAFCRGGKSGSRSFLVESGARRDQLFVIPKKSSRGRNSIYGAVF